MVWVVSPFIREQKRKMCQFDPISFKRNVHLRPCMEACHTNDKVANMLFLGVNTENTGTH